MILPKISFPAKPFTSIFGTTTPQMTKRLKLSTETAQHIKRRLNDNRKFIAPMKTMKNKNMSKKQSLLK